MTCVSELSQLLLELDDQLVSCMRCGLCQAVCPIYIETGSEVLVARGKIALLEHLAHEMIKDVLGVKDRVETCLLCGACAANCPSGVKVIDIFLKARAILAGYIGLSPLKKLIFRGLLVRPGLCNALFSLASKFQILFTKPVSDTLGSSSVRFNTESLGVRHFPALAEVALYRMVPKLDQTRKSGDLKVAFFPGCMVDKIFPNVGKAVLKVLAHHNVSVFLPKNQACCGIPALSLGDLYSFKKLVDLNLERFEGGDFDYLVTACATCATTIKKFWGEFAGGNNLARREALSELASKTLDISVFLVDIVKAKEAVVLELNSDRQRVTVHDPCHLKNSLGVTEKQRIMVRLNPNVELVEMAETNACCGCGGSFTLLHYDLADKIGKKKRNNIVASGAQAVATGCPACMLQITDMLSKSGDQVVVRHPVEIYADALD